MGQSLNFAECGRSSLKVEEGVGVSVKTPGGEQLGKTKSLSVALLPFDVFIRGTGWLLMRRPNTPYGGVHGLFNLDTRARPRKWRRRRLSIISHFRHRVVPLTNFGKRSAPFHLDMNHVRSSSEGTDRRMVINFGTAKEGNEMRPKLPLSVWRS